MHTLDAAFMQTLGTVFMHNGVFMHILNDAFMHVLDAALMHSLHVFVVTRQHFRQASLAPARPDGRSQRRNPHNTTYKWSGNMSTKQQRERTEFNRTRFLPVWVLPHKLSDEDLDE